MLFRCEFVPLAKQHYRYYQTQLRFIPCQALRNIMKLRSEKLSLVRIHKCDRVNVVSFRDFCRELLQSVFCRQPCTSEQEICDAICSLNRQ